MLYYSCMTAYIVLILLISWTLTTAFPFVWILPFCGIWGFVAGKYLFRRSYDHLKAFS